MTPQDCVIIRLVVVLCTCLGASRGDINLQYSMDEEVDIGYQLGNLAQEPQVAGGYTASLRERLKFGLLPGAHRHLFQVVEDTGLLFVRERVDRDAIPQCASLSLCTLSVEAAITQPLEEFTVIHLDITVRDTNDNAPRFSNSHMALTLSENAEVGSSLLLPTAMDPDSDANTIREYQLNLPHAMFDLELNPGSPVTGVGSGLYLVLKDRVDHETQALYSLEVVAIDGGSPSLRGILYVDIQVVDANDNSPVFGQAAYNVTVPEDQPVGQTFFTVHATDEDFGLNGQVVYGFSQQTRDQYHSVFGLNNLTGEIYLKRPLDYRMGMIHQLVVVAQDMGADSQQAHTTVTVQVRDVNNHQPVITVSGVVSDQDIGVEENAAAGSIVAVISVEDSDPGENGRCSCEILDGNFQLLDLYRNGFKVVTTRAFDRELEERFQSVVQCSDHGSPSLISRTQINVNVYDVNDNAPEFDSKSYQVRVQENSTANTGLVRVVATDRDLQDSPNSDISYSLEEAARQFLDIDTDTGDISLKNPLDFEMAPYFEFTLYAQDQGFPSQTGQATLRIDVVDINDEAALFTQNDFNFGTYENQANVTEIGTIEATDRDTSPYDRFVYSLVGGPEITELFSIDESGTLYTKWSLDREDQAVYEMVVVATNVYPPKQSTSVSVTVYVADKNDNAPTVSFPNGTSDSVEVSVYSPVDYFVTHVRAVDQDLGTNAKLTYSLSNNIEWFSVDPFTGNLYVRTSLQGVVDTDMELHILVSDSGNPPLSTTAVLHVSLNTSLVFAKEHGVLPGDPESGGLTRHERILAILGAVTGLLVLLLVCAIVFVRRRQVHNSKETFRCMQRVDYSHKLEGQTASDTDLGAPQHCPVHGSSGSSLWLDKPHHQPPSYNTVARLGGGDTLEKPQPKMLNTMPQTRPKDCLSPSQKDNSCRTPPRLSSFATKHGRDLDSDTASRCSAEVSNTDSGHGPSEEGDVHDSSGTQHHHHGTTLPTHTGQTPHRHPCPVHGSTDTGAAPQGSDSISLPHLNSRRRPPSLKSHEQGVANYPVSTRPQPGVHGHRKAATTPTAPLNNASHYHPQQNHNNNNLSQPSLSGASEPRYHPIEMNNLSDEPPERPPKPHRPLSSSFKPPPTNLWINSNKFYTPTTSHGDTGAGPTSGDPHHGADAWAGGPETSAIAEESDDDTASSASSGSFVLNIHDMRSVDV